MSIRPAIRAMVLLLLLTTLVWENGAAIATFARRYKVRCQFRHNPFPALIALGEQFAANGYQMSPTEELQDTIATGDELLGLLKALPLAMRLDRNAQGDANGRASTDFHSPYVVKLFEDYIIDRARLGQVPVDLTYDRGFVATAEVAGYTVTGELLNSNGIDGPNDDHGYDIDPGKNVFLHATRDIAGPLSLGGFGYYGRATGGSVRDLTTMFRGNGTLAFGPRELNGQYLHRRNDRPTFTAGEPAVTLDMGFGEALLRPANSRWYGFVRYSLASANRPRYEGPSAGVGHPLRRKVRLIGDFTQDLERQDSRFTLGLVAAF